MNYSQLKNAIAEVIRTNGNEEITGEVLQYTLLEMVSVLGKDYQFAGVGTPLTDTTERDDNVAWILGRGTYENFGNPFTVAVDEIAVVKYDGTFTVEKIKTGVVVDSELTLEGTNPVQGGAIAREFAKMRAAGYIFAGIMTPTGTPPHEITEKIFYLCTQAGVYPNFDAIVLDRGLNILKWNGSRWSADLVFAITDDVTEGLASLLTSAGAYAAIAAEAQLRQEGDAAVQQNIDAVEALIPSQASVDNKLVDEQKMNSSIATATATYRGAYNQVSNLNLGVDATHEQVVLALASQMTYLHITPDNNDYCYVLVPTSAETPTEIAHIDRYKFNGTAWAYEYTLNNSGYTAEQWAAINSGITSGLVAKLGALPTAADLAAALLAKQDVLTFDQAPTPSSTNPVTSGGVYTAIDNEKGARINEDAALQQAIEAILLLIPSAATALNQLADKAFVNSSIATATATFRGTFNLVSDLQLTVDATHADIATALLNAISTADNNDYAFVQIPTSVDTPTEIRVTERYKFNGTAWSYEYDLNNSGFTAAQWAAINSGITALLVTKLSNLPNATELAALFAGKQNVLTFDNAPVSGSDNPVKSGGLYNLFAAIDAKMPTGASANNKLVAEDRLAAYVGGIIGALDATFDLTSTDGHVTLRMTQTDGVITSLQILTSDIASASALATLGGQVSTNASDIAALQALYNALQQSAPQVIEPTDTWPVANPSDTVIYRVIDRVNTPPQYYSDYMWNGTSMVLMATYNNAIDPRPKKASQNLVTSGGVFNNMGALDVSELNATENPHTLAQYVDLSAALAAVPTDYQKGGMSIKFVQSSDNKYMQYFLTKDEWSASEADWEKMNLEEEVSQLELWGKTRGSLCIMKSGGGRCVDSLIKDNLNIIISFYSNVTLFGNSNSQIFDNVSYGQFLISGDYTIGNLQMLIADLENKTLNVISAEYPSYIVDNSSSTKIIIAVNLWGVLISPIASLQEELYQKQYLNNDISTAIDTAIDNVISNKADVLDVISASQVGKNVGSVQQVLGIDSYNRIAPTKIAGTEFNMPYAEQQVSYSDNRTTYTLEYEITDKCSIIKFIFRAIFNKDIGATLYFRDENGSWLHNENAVTQYFSASQDVNNFYEVSRKVEEGAAKAVLIIGSGTTAPLPADTTLKVGWSKVILQGSSFDENIEPIINEIIVAQSGGDFTSVRDAVVSIADNSYYNRYKIFVKNGTYNEIDIKTKDYVDIVGESRDGVILYTDGLRTDNSPSDYNWGGGDYANIPINTIPKAWKHLFIHMSNSTISNMTLKVGNCKYVIHQDNASNKYEAFVRNCTFIREEDFNTNVGEYDQSLMRLIGVGAYPGQYQRYYDCDFIMNVKNIPTNAKIENFAMFVWHNWNNMTGQEACGATFENCNLFNCSVGDLSDLGSDTKDIIHLHNIHVDSNKFGLYYNVTPGYYRVDGQVVSDPSQIPYCIIADIQNCNFGFTILGKYREAGISKVLNPETIALVQVSEPISFGQPVTINKYSMGSQQIASSEPFGFAMQNANANNACYISTGMTGRGLSVADTYSYGDAIYINNGKFTKVVNGNQVGICIEDLTLTEDGLLMISKI